MIMVTFTKLFVIRIVANKRSLLSSKLLIFSSEGCFLSAITFKSDGEREKRLFRKLMQSRKRAKANLPTQWLQWPK